MNADRRGGTVIDGRVVAPDAHAGDTAPGDERRTEEDIATGVRGYLVGLVLATVLTAAVNVVFQARSTPPCCGITVT